MASAARQADYWSLGHVEPDDVIIADIGGQALDIFLHGPESAHKNGIVKTFTHTSIPIHPCILLKKGEKSFIPGDSNWKFFQVGYPVDTHTNMNLLLRVSVTHRPALARLILGSWKERSLRMKPPSLPIVQGISGSTKRIRNTF